MSQREAASKLNISQSTIQRILKERQEIEQSANSARKRFRTGRTPDVDAAVVNWIHDALERNAPLSGPLVMQKAEELAKQLNHSTFKANDGWFHRFKKREGLVHKRLYREGQTVNTLSHDCWTNTLSHDHSFNMPSPDHAFDVPSHDHLFDMSSHDHSIDMLSRDNWIDRAWPELRQAYFDEDIWSTKESEIYLRASPDDKTGKCKKGITVLFTCSMTGDKKTLPVAYDAGSSSWMTGNLFSSWLREWDRELRSQHRHILLLLDNHSTLPPNIELTNIRVSFFPPNTTSVLQPCDIIRTVKAHMHMCRSLSGDMENASHPAVASDVAEKIPLLDAIHRLNQVWEDVEPVSIRNSWVKCGLRVGPQEQDGTEDIPVLWEVSDTRKGIDEDLPVAKPISGDAIIAEVKQDNIDLENGDEETKVINDGARLNIDKDLAAAGSVSGGIVNGEVKQEVMDYEVEDAEASANGDNKEVIPPTEQEMRDALSVLRRGLCFHGFYNVTLLHQFECAVNDLINENLDSQ